MNSKIKAAIIKNFINPLEDGCKYNLIKLNGDKLKHRETISLLNQTYRTLNNSYELLNKYEFIDANSLLRSATEYLAMAMLIEEDDKIYKEYIDLYLLERKETNPTKLLGKFGGKLKKYSNVLFDNTNRKEREKLMLDMYDTLCSYTHSTLLINLFENIKKEEDNEVLKMFMYLNYYFIKLIFYSCLKYINKNNDNYLENNNIVVTYLFYINEIRIYIKENKLDFKKYNRYLHLEENNKTYLDVNKDKITTMLDELNKIEITEDHEKIFKEICNQYFE